MIRELIARIILKKAYFQHISPIADGVFRLCAIGALDLSGRNPPKNPPSKDQNCTWERSLSILHPSGFSVLVKWGLAHGGERSKAEAGAPGSVGKGPGNELWET